MLQQDLAIPQKTGQVPGKKVKGGLRKNGVHLQIQIALMNKSLN